MPKPPKVLLLVIVVYFGTSIAFYGDPQYGKIAFFCCLIDGIIEVYNLNLNLKRITHLIVVMMEKKFKRTNIYV